MAVGIFDSGLGGLTILDAVQRRLPDVPFVYLADSAHAPYGVRTPDDIYDLTTAAVQRLFDAGCDLVVLACNTASAAALRFSAARSGSGWSRSRDSKVERHTDCNRCGSIRSTINVPWVNCVSRTVLPPQFQQL